MHSCGHSEFQIGYRQEHKIGEEDANDSKLKLKELLLKAEVWNEHLKLTRREYYFLNFYTMREILKMNKIITNWKNEENDKRENEVEEEEEPVTEPVVEEVVAAVDFTSPQVLTVCEMGFPPEHASLALARCDNNVDQAVVSRHT